MGVANVVNVYRKVYGCGIPTPGKLKNTGLITGTLEKIYQIGKADAGADRCRAGEIVGLVMDKYDTPGAFRDWLADSATEMYFSGFREGRGMK